MNAQVIVCLLLEDAPAILVTDNLPLVTTVVKRMSQYAKNLEWDDLMQIGAKALVNAAEKFDPSRGMKFSTYAYEAIKNEIIKAVEKDRVHTPPKENVSLDKTVGDEDSTELHDIIPDEAAFDPESEAEKVDSKRVLMQMISSLKKGEQDTLKGILAGKSFTEIAKDQGTSVAYISQQAKRGISKLRERLLAKGYTGVSEIGSLTSKEEKSFDDKSVRSESIARECLRLIIEQVENGPTFCPCGNKDDFEFYDGLLGYEAVICTKCGRYADHTGIHDEDFYAENPEENPHSGKRS
jgi:RNA polymerase sigma factor (sigma-70 family)